MSAEDRQLQLLMLLNTLENVVIELPDVSGDDEPTADPPAISREQIAAAFPEFGYYHAITPSSVDQDEEPVVGDAVDDLRDIVTDMTRAVRLGEVNWRSGAWEAKFSHAHHSGSHLADLRSHLYRLRFFGP